jgi:hypothetical protein
MADCFYNQILFSAVVAQLLSAVMIMVDVIPETDISSMVSVLGNDYF